MFKHKQNLVIGMTTYFSQFLELSVPALARLKTDFTLIIYNDNPDNKVTTNYIRNLGFRGRVHIINGVYNIGLLQARLAILDYMSENKINSDWILFTDDDCIVTDVNIPDVSDNNFAIIQNMAVVRTRLVDVFRAATDFTKCVIDNENIVLVRPHLGLGGTLVRTPIMMKTGMILKTCLDKFFDIDTGLRFLPPVDAMMWSGVNIVAQYLNKNYTPIYMDNINYVSVDLDRAATKYGMPIKPARNADTQIANVLARYDAVILSAISAAPAGQ